MTPAQFAERFPVGTPVRFYPVRGLPHYEETTIRSEPWELGNGAIVIKITGRTGGVQIEHIQRI